MKKAEFVRMIMLAGMIAAACTPKQNTIVPAAQVAQSSAVAGAPQPAIEPGSLEDFRANVGDTVRFAYDGYTLDDQARVTLEKQADWLARYQSVRCCPFQNSRFDALESPTVSSQKKPGNPLTQEAPH